MKFVLRKKTYYKSVYSKSVLIKINEVNEINW